MPYNALEWHVSVQMNVTRAGFAVSYFVSHTCWQPLPQRVNSVNANDSTAAGIKREATEKLYERHYLVIKIVSSFFACLIKFLYL